MILAKVPVFINSSNFENNIASLNGGAIFFSQLPFDQVNCSYINNQALYGKLNGSYPLRLKLSESTLKNLNYSYFLSDMPTGVLFPISLEVEVCDMYFQKITTLNDGYITVNILANENFSGFQNIEGITVQKISNGTAIFDHLLIFSNPVNITNFLKFSSPKIDENIFDLTLTLLQKENYEILNIPVLSYSFNPLNEKCLECPIISDCFGGMNLSLHPGYWRSNIYSELFLECEPFPDSCLFIFFFFFVILFLITF